MASRPDKHEVRDSSLPEAATTEFPVFPADTTLHTQEQRQRFELLRLASFVLKLRKLEQQAREAPKKRKSDIERQEFRRSLLRHVIFQQVVTLIHLDAREQAFQILGACRI